MKLFNKVLKFLFFAVIVRFIVLVILGLNIRHKKNLPKKGPAIIVANHNSHLDTLVLMNCLPQKLLSIVQPVAAADYFLKNKFLAWFSKEIIGIIPIDRKKASEDPLNKCYQALTTGKILILFPEGTRGEPEKLVAFKKGVAYLATKFPEVPVIPVFIHGLGKALPKGDFLLVPFFCDIFIGKALQGFTSKAEFMTSLQEQFQALVKEYQSYGV